MRRRLLALATAVLVAGSLASCTSRLGSSAEPPPAENNSSGGSSSGLGGIGGGGGGGLFSNCKPVHVIVARGTFEPRGTSPFGAGTFASTLALRTGGSVWDVPYRADLDYIVAPVQGANKTVQHLKERARQCPNEKYVLTGYSKGAMVMVNAMSSIPADIEPRVRAVVLFGNPFHDPRSPANAPGHANNAGGLVPGVNIPQKWRSKTRDYCNQGDPICGAGINILAHITYTGDATAALRWTMDQLR